MAEAASISKIGSKAESKKKKKKRNHQEEKEEEEPQEQELRQQEDKPTTTTTTTTISRTLRFIFSNPILGHSGCKCGPGMSAWRHRRDPVKVWPLCCPS
jgi:hypothetical protein